MTASVVLARDQRVRGEGVGDLLLADAVRRVISVSRSLAVFAIVVEAPDKQAAPLSRLWIRAHFRAARSDLFMPVSEAAEAASRALSQLKMTSSVKAIAGAFRRVCRHNGVSTDHRQ